MTSGECTPPLVEDETHSVKKHRSRQRTLDHDDSGLILPEAERQNRVEAGTSNDLIHAPEAHSNQNEIPPLTLSDDRFVNRRFAELLSMTPEIQVLRNYNFASKSTTDAALILFMMHMATMTLVLGTLAVVIYEYAAHGHQYLTLYDFLNEFSTVWASFMLICTAFLYHIASNGLRWWFRLDDLWTHTSVGMSGDEELENSRNGVSGVAESPVIRGSLDTRPDSNAISVVHGPMQFLDSLWQTIRTRSSSWRPPTPQSIMSRSDYEPVQTAEAVSEALQMSLLERRRRMRWQRKHRYFADWNDGDPDFGWIAKVCGGGLSDGKDLDVEVLARKGKFKVVRLPRATSKALSTFRRVPSDEGWTVPDVGGAALAFRD